MAANQVVGTTYGTFRKGFKWEKLKYGMWKLLTAAFGYAIIAFAVYYAKEYVSNIEYLSGILLEPIARYFINVVDKLKALVNENVSKVIEDRENNKQN